jgi:hypothetical protein
MKSSGVGFVLKTLCRVAESGAGANMTPPPRTRLHPDILKLGLVSFLTDLSSEMVFSVFAVFFTSVAGASASLLYWLAALLSLVAMGTFAAMAQVGISRS